MTNRTDVPESPTIVPRGADPKTFGEVAEIISMFQASPWKTMMLSYQGLQITLGKDGPPDAIAGVAPPAQQSAPPLVSPANPAPAQTPPAPAQTPPAPAQTPPEAAPVSPPGDATTEDVDLTGCTEVRSPTVGTFWTAPNPGSAPFTEVGAHIQADDQLAIVEVMKLMNPVVATTSGTIVSIAAKNSELVEFDQVLFWIRPDAS